MVAGLLRINKARHEPTDIKEHRRPDNKTLIRVRNPQPTRHLPVRAEHVLPLVNRKELHAIEGVYRE